MLRTFVFSIVFYPPRVASIVLDPMLKKKLAGFNFHMTYIKKKRRTEYVGINGIKKKVHAVSLLSKKQR